MVYLQAVMSEKGPAAACLDLCERDFVEDLLSLSDDDAFRNSYPSLAIIEPPEFLRQVRIQIATDLGYE